MRRLTHVRDVFAPAALLFRCLALVIGLLLLPDAVAATADRPRGFEISVEGSLLTVAVENVPLEDVLRRIGREAGFPTIIHGNLQAPVDMSFVDLPLEEGVRRLAGEHSVAILFKGEKGDGKNEASEEIAKLWVFEGEGVDRLGGAPAASPVPGDFSDHAAQDPAEVLLQDLGYPGGISGFDVVQQVGRFNDETAVGILEHVLRDDEMGEVRGLAIDELREIGSDAAVQAMATGLGDNDVQIRLAVVESLSQIDSIHAIQILGQAVIGDDDPSVRLSAVRALGKRQSEAANALLSTAAEDPDEEVRTLARGYLGLR